MPKSRFASSSGLSPADKLRAALNERIRLNNDRHTVTTRQGERTVSGKGTALMIRNAEIAAGFPSVVTPAEPLRVELAREIDAAKSPGLEEPTFTQERQGVWQPVEVEQPVLTDEQFEPTLAPGEIEIVPLSSPSDPVPDRAAREYELEGMTAKALRPLASAAGMKGARVAGKGDMIAFLLDSEFGS